MYKFIVEFIYLGLFVGYSKPSLEEFLIPLVGQLLALEYGMSYENRWYKFFLLFAVFDKPARALILNSKLASSYFGCIKCEVGGECVPFGNGTHIIFRNEGAKRTPLSYINNVNLAIETKSIVKGVKGVCLLSKLKHFNPFHCTIIDIMHSVFLGVVKNLFYYFFEAPANNPFSLKNKISILNKKLSIIRPPNFIQQAPRKLDEYKKWRSHEFMNFILFFAIPLLKDEMDEIYYQHILLLIISLECLLGKKILKSKLTLVNDMLKLFVRDAQDLYDIHFLSSGVHELLHLVQSTLESGNLYVISCYPYEELNRKITRFIKGQDLVGDEFIKLWCSSKNFSLHVKKNFSSESNNSFVLFLKKYFSIRSSNIKNPTDLNFVLKLGKSIKYTIEEKNFYFDKFKHKIDFSIDVSKLTFFERFYFNNLLYTIIDLNTKFCNSVILFQNQVGLICHIIQVESEIYLICKKLIPLNVPIQNLNFTLQSSFSYFTFSQTVFYVHYGSLRDIKKLFLYNLNENNLCLISKYTSNHLFS